MTLSLFKLLALWLAWTSRNSITFVGTILALGREILESTASWQVGKTYVKGTVQTLSRAKRLADGISKHTKEDARFDYLWSKLGVNKAENEKEFISAVKNVTLSIWTLYYTFLPPVSPCVCKQYTSTKKFNMVVSIPVDLSGLGDKELAKLEEKLEGTKRHYVSVEHLVELEDGKVEWQMAMSRQYGSMGGQIFADVPHFLKWFHTACDQGT
ncbi:hypothetical protein K503DRAFT_794746 [Rhizopogon vinicolor AM-OR11-026]|uniref:DUF3074 domain-containing protein n=1 Tax=Rhizopogon vinicolor AM-OR11-026 TaxID=1314800 RepID=A0A1B7MIR3_9AGAM|nr:hypothetical protein K503DRAFT_794746 [Rhizopogon vinicolor AM-OR11-026]